MKIALYSEQCFKSMSLDFLIFPPSYRVLVLSLECGWSVLTSDSLLVNRKW